MKTDVAHQLKKLSRMQKPAAIGAAVLFLYAIAGFLVAPPIVKHLLQKNISRHLQREARIERLAINPFTLAVEIDGFSLKEKGSSTDDFASFKRLYVNLQGVSAFVLAPVIAEITLVDPYLKIVRTEDKQFNFADLFSAKDAEGKGKEQSTPARFAIRGIAVQNGTVEIVDRPLDRKHLIRDIHFTLPEIDSMKGDEGDRIEPRLTAQVNNSPVSLQGQVKVFAAAGGGAAVDIAVEGLELPYYAAYLPPQLNLKVVAGRLNVGTRLSYTQSEQRQAAVKLSADAALSGLKVTAKDDHGLLELDKLTLSVADFDPFAGPLHIARVDIGSPTLNVSRDGNGQINLATLYTPGQRAEQKQPGELKEMPKAPPFSVVVDELQVADGKVTFSDSVPATPFKTTLFPVNVQVKHFNTAPESKTEFSFSAKTDAGEALAANGSLALQPLACTGNLTLGKIPIPRYASYFKDFIRFDVRSATADLAAEFHYAGGGKSPSIQLNHLAASVNALQLRMQDADEDFVNIGAISLDGGELDLDRKQLGLGQITSHHGLVKITRHEDGSFNFQQLLPQSAAQTQMQEAPQPASDETPWRVTLNNAKLSDYAIEAEDRKAPQPVTLTVDELQIALQNFSTAAASESGVALSFLFNDKGRISIDGKAKISPLFADLKIGIENLDIAQLEPYYHDYVKVFVTGGTLSAAGNVILDQEDPNATKASYAGDFAIMDFSSLPKAEGEEIVKWKTFALQGIDAGNAPPRVKIGKVDLAGFTSYIRVNPDGTINFRQVLKAAEEMPQAAPAAGTAEPQSDQQHAVTVQPRNGQAQTARPAEQAADQSQAGSEPLLVAIDQIALQEGVIDFTDNLIQPNFHASFFDAAGTVSGLSSQPGTSADVRITAKVDEYAPAEITGKINPLTKDLFADLTVAASNIDMTISNPYAQKFAGYHIEKGKLDFNFQYKIDQGNLNANHHVVFDDLTLGNKTDSPEATTLPLKLAVSLLQDRNGDIILDVPVSGAVNDPQFDFSKVIKTAISNVLAKIVTAPFALLGSIFGGGKEQQLNYVEFAAGSSAITPEAAKKLDVLARGLFERPKLELEAAGYVDRQKDATALAGQKPAEKPAAPAAKDAAKAEAAGRDAAARGAAAQPAGDSQTTPAQQPAKAAGKGAPPQQAAEPGAKKPAAVEVKVDAKQLQELARERAKNVRDYLVKSGKIEAKRIFVVSPQALEPKDKEAPTKSSVILSLK